MNNLYLLEKYFTTGTAESEDHILADAFVPLSDFLEIINPPHASPRLLVGKKGSGKSAFIRVLKSSMENANVTTLLIKPEDIAIDEIKPHASIGEITRLATVALLDAIAGKIGIEQNGLLTQDDEIVLAEYAQTTGRKRKDFVQKLVQVLSPIGTGLTKIDFEKMAKDFGHGTKEEVKQAVTKNMGKNEKVFFLLIDDTDQVASLSEPTHLNRIWAFILAARSISQKCKNLRCIITLRTEVWSRLQRDDAGQRDQVDHFRNLVIYLNPNDDDVAHIVERRFKLIIDELQIKASSVYQPFFHGASVSIPTSTEVRSWRDFIVKRSRQRPRDAVQLVALLLKAARQSNSDKIDSNHVAKSMSKYSEERVEDLRLEVVDECKQVVEIVRSFASVQYDAGSFTLTAEALLRHLDTLPSRFSISLFGVVLRVGVENSSFKLWKYLFDVGLFAARVKDSKQEKGYSHINPLDDIDLIAKPRWNELQRYTWEINPAYRDFLLEIRKKENLGMDLSRRGSLSRKKTWQN